METAFLALVNYMITGILIVYDIQALQSMHRKDEYRSPRRRVAMKLEMISIFALCHLTMYLRTREIRYWGVFFLLLFTFAGLSQAYHRLYPKLSGLLFDQMILLLGVGATAQLRLDFGSAIRQFLIVAAALVAGLFIPGFIRAMHRLERYGYAYLGLGLLILTGVFVFAGERLGARIWIKIFGVAMQPFEFVKITFIFGCAAVLLRCKKWYEKAAVFVLAGAHILIMVASKDLGGALLFAFVLWIVLYASDGRKFWIFGGALGGAAACAAAYLLFYHVRVRVIAWRDPFAVVDNEGYQLSQSLFAIGNGGFFGTGLFAGAPDQIPVVTTDYIFSAICEELGALFALGLLFIYLNCLLLLIRMIKRCAEDYYRLVFTGFAALFTAQILLNVGGVIRMIPSTGVPLPFVSAGGSSAASMVLMFMLIQGMQERTEGTEEAKEYKDGFRPESLGPKAQIALNHCMKACCAVLIFVAGYFTVFSLTEARKVIFNSYNRRQVKLEEQNAKGTIFDANGNPIAFTMLLDDEEVRKYPYGRLFSHVVGQTMYGKSGLESVKEIDLLTASVGEFTKLSYRIRGEQIPGNNLFTTLDAEVQKQLYEILSDGQQAPVGGCIIDFATGGLVASVSLPDFLPDNAKESENAEDAPLFNRVFYGEYFAPEPSEVWKQMQSCFADGMPTPFGEKIHPEIGCVTPFAAAVFAGMCTNGGVCPEVYVAEKLTDAGGRVLYRMKQEEQKLLDEQTARKCLELFETMEAEATVVYRIEKLAAAAERNSAMIAAVCEGKGTRYAISMVLENTEEQNAAQILEEKLKKVAEVLGK